MKRRFALLLCLVALLGVSVLPAVAQTPPKQTEMLPMRDGVKLATDVFVPPGKGPFPTLLFRTPYNKDALSGLGAAVAQQRGYAVVIQDTRGRFASQGENLPFIGDFWGEHADGYDTLEWIAKQPWCSGKIGTLGGSALGITQIGEAGSGTTRLTAQHIEVAPPSLYQYTTFPGGVFKKALVEDWLKATQHDPRSAAFWTQHPDYDAFWRSRDLTTRWNNANAPAMHIGGWYDIFSQGTLDDFVGYQTLGGPKARGKQKLIIGPWTHGLYAAKVGELTFPNGNHVPNNIQDSLRWFDFQLKGMDNGMGSIPAVTYYVMGDTTDASAPGNVWRTAAQWPPLPTRDTPYYFHADNILSTTKPAQDAPITYAYDPQNPVPTVGGPQLTIPAGPLDQRKIETRPDVVLFTSEPLAGPLEVTGRVRVLLWAASDAPDTDFVTKLCDVYPDGRSINICEGVLRARFRESLRTEKLLKPGEVYRFAIDLWSTSMIFNKGHRLRVQVTSSSSPGYDPNPNTGAPFRADSRTQVAHNTIYFEAKHPSQILLPIPIPPNQ